MLTDEEIEYLIGCPKIITSAPKKDMISNFGSLRNDMNLQSVDGKIKFHVFMRISEAFSENFTIGLDYVIDGSNICIFRCNGKHGVHTNNELGDNHHFHYHIHKAKADYIARGYKTDKFAEVTESYATYQDALDYFLVTCNIVSRGKYFEEHKMNNEGSQVSMFEIIKGGNND